MSLKVIADDKIPFLKGALEPYLDIEYLPGNAISRKDVADADALLIRTRTRCNAELLEGTNLSFIASATIGYDHIDTRFCEEQGIIWTNAPGCNSGSVMQYIASALLSYAKDNDIDLTQRVMGVVGVGNVGTKIMRLGESLGMHVLLNDPPRVREEGICGFISLEGILREADIITLHVPLNPAGEDKTFHLAGQKFFEKINPGTLLINSSRGEVVDTAGLTSALVENQIAGAILDVWENEPQIDTTLLEKVTMATPHIAGYSVDGKANGTRMSVQALSRFFGLGIEEWEPEDLPEPAEPNIVCDGSNKSFQEILTELVLHTYQIKREMEWLIRDPARFEYYRGAYPVRREFHAYRVEAHNVKEEDKRKLRRLGFQLV